MTDMDVDGVKEAKEYFEEEGHNFSTRRFSKKLIEEIKRLRSEEIERLRSRILRQTQGCLDRKAKMVLAENDKLREQIDSLTTENAELKAEMKAHGKERYWEAHIIVDLKKKLTASEKKLDAIRAMAENPESTGWFSGDEITEKL